MRCMSDNITQLPFQSTNEWKIFREKNEKFLIDNGAPPEVIGPFFSQFQPIYESFLFSYTFNFTCPKSVDSSTFKKINSQLNEFRDKFRAHMNRLIEERLAREFKIYINQVKLPLPEPN